jgi:uncharacterized membrane protein
MKLFEKQTLMPYPIEDVFALTVNLEKAPYWHHIFTDVQQLTPNPIGVGSRWKVSYGMGNFDLEITDYQPPSQVVFRGSSVMGMIPNFTIQFQSVSDGTQVQYLLHPDMPRLLQPIMKIIGPPYGSWDLDRYFRELNVMLAS